MTVRRLTVVSHPCVTPLNQQFFAEVAAVGGFEVDLVVPARWRSDFGGEELHPTPWAGLEGRVHPLPVVGAGNVPLHAYRGRLGRLFARLRPDVVYVHHEPYGLATAQVFAALSGARVPVGFYSAQNLVKAYPFPFSRLERWVHARAAFGIAVSDRVAGVLAQKGYAGPTTVLPLGCDGTRFAPEGDAETYPVPTVGFVGRLVPEKGVDVLVQAARRLPSDVGVAVVGDGPLGPAIEALRRERPNVFWSRRVGHTEIPRYLRGFRLLVLPSVTTPTWCEQFGRVLVEAAACGTPVIGSDSGEIPNLVATLEAGRVVPEGDPAALAEAIRTAMAAPARLAAWREAGLRRAAAFHNRALARRFHDVVAAALAGVGRA